MRSPAAHPPIALICALVVLAGCGGGDSKPPPERRSVPRGFIGTVVDGPLTQAGFGFGGLLERELEVMVASGIESIRMPVHWSAAQPYRSWRQVPANERSRFEDAGGVPTDFRDLDRIVGAASRRGISLLPTVLAAPSWAAKYPGRFNSPPRIPEAYSRYMGALAHRYGPAGSFWRSNRELRPVPIRSWMVWNEPYLRNYWRDQPFAPAYVRLLAAARRTVKRIDPGAQVMVAGLASFGRTAWEYLEDLYRAGAGRGLDAVAAHPFTRRPRGVLGVLRRMRAVMRRHGDARLPLLVTELSWPSAKGERKKISYPWEETERGQAVKVRRAIELLARHRRELRLQAVYHYNWLAPEDGRDSFAWAGLRRLAAPGRAASKPALGALRGAALALEGCEAKRGTAARCERPLR